MEKQRTLAQWTQLGERKLRVILEKAYAVPALKRLGPKAAWIVNLRLVSGPAMTRLNGEYRGKPYATDVLSFPAPSIFRAQGVLGELVVCIPVMKKQAKELKHSADQEFEVLLTHGVLHLLGLDHEVGEREADQMARFEEKLLGPRSAGLIKRG